MVRLYQRKGGEVLVDTGTADNQASQSVPMPAGRRVVAGWSQAEAQALGSSFAQSDPPAGPAGGPDAINVPGDDNTYYVDDPATKIEEGPFGGNDRVFTSVSYVLTPGSQIELLSTNDHASTDAINLTGNSWAQTLIGNAGRNILHGGGGSDLLIGLGGDDIYYVDVSSTRLDEYEGGGNDALYVSVSYSLETAGEVELLSTNDYLSTQVLNLTGNRFGQTIIGNDGASILDGGGGIDTLIGLGGNDRYHVGVAATRVIEYDGGGNDQVYVSMSYVLGAGEIETLAIDSHFPAEAIDLTGNAHGQSLVGNAAANILNGGGGTDLLFGLGGNDVYYVDVAATQIVEYESGGTDIAYVSLSYTLGGGAEVETLSANDYASTAALTFTGNLYGQTIIGNAGNNIVNGGGGADTLIGLGGNDIYYVDVAGTRVSEAIGAGADIVYVSVSYALAAGSEVETLSANNHAATTALGLTGNAFANTVFGNAGGNAIDGKDGNDQLVGMAGADTFAFTTALGAGNIDVIYDFAHNTDKIALDDAIFTALGGPGALNANAFFAGAAAHDADDRIIYDGTTGQLLYDADGDGMAAAVQFASLATGLPLTASDFQVI